MRFEPVDAKELSGRFEFELLSAHLFGMTCSFGTGLEQPVVDAINEVAKAYPNDTEDQHNKARKAFRGERV